jgi:hypothetical protein
MAHIGFDIRNDRASNNLACIRIHKHLPVPSFPPIKTQ